VDCDKGHVMTRKDEMLDALCDHVLEQGLAGASLRPLAAAVGTSDRMLLYYFPDKSALIGAILHRLADRQASVLEAAGSANGERMSPDALLARLWPALETPVMRSFMQLWLEVAAAASRGAEPHGQISGEIIDRFVAWIGARLDVPEASREMEAVRLLALVDGMSVLRAGGRGELAARMVTQQPAST
jgi:AcrR family transcriptional regulator